MITYEIEITEDNAGDKEVSYDMHQVFKKGATKEELIELINEAARVDHNDYFPYEVYDIEYRVVKFVVKRGDGMYLLSNTYFEYNYTENIKEAKKFDLYYNASSLCSGLYATRRKLKVERYYE